MARGKRTNYSKVFGIPKQELASKISGVYKITCLLNQKVYIGYSDNIYKRWKGHFRSMSGKMYGNKFLIEDALEFGVENFSFEILEICESGFDAFYGGTEAKYINLYKSTDRKRGYNILRGF